MSLVKSLIDDACVVSEDIEEYVSKEHRDEIRSVFLYLLDRKDDMKNLYWISFPQALKWLENDIEGSELYEKRRNFKKKFHQFKPGKSSFTLGMSDDDRNGRVIMRAVPESVKAEKLALELKRQAEFPEPPGSKPKESKNNEEIWFSTKGFKLFCMYGVAKTKKTGAVLEYFLEVEEDYWRTLQANKIDNERELAAIKLRNAELEKAQGERPTPEFINDGDTRDMIHKLNVELLELRNKVYEGQRNIFQAECIAEEVDNPDLLRSRASAILRDRFLKYKFVVYLVNPTYIRERKKRSATAENSKRCLAPKLAAPKNKSAVARRSAKEDMEFSSDSDRAESKDPEPPAYNEPVDDCELDHTEAYADQFSSMSAADLDLYSCYFFAVVPKNKEDSVDTKVMQFICTLECSTSTEVKRAFGSLGSPIISRPLKIYLTTYSNVRNCADQSICDLDALNRKRAGDSPSSSDDERAVSIKARNEERRAIMAANRARKSRTLLLESCYIPFP